MGSVEGAVRLRTPIGQTRPAGAGVVGVAGVVGLGDAGALVGGVEDAGALGWLPACWFLAQSVSAVTSSATDATTTGKRRAGNIVNTFSRRQLVHPPSD